MNTLRSILFSFLLLLPAIAQSQLRISPEAQQALATNNFAPAIEELSNILSLEPGNEATLTARANIYNRAGKATNALADAKAALRLNSRSYAAAYMAAVAYTTLGDYKEAISTMNTGLIYKRDFIEGVQLVAKLYLKTEQYTMASAYFTEAIQINPKAPENYLFRARARARGTGAPESIPDYQTVLRMAPESSEVYKLAQSEIKEPLQTQQHTEDRKKDAKKAEENALVTDLVLKVRQIETTYLQTVKPLEEEMMAHILATQKAIKDGNRSNFEASQKSALQMFTRQEIAYLKARIDLKALGMDATQEPLSSMTRLHKSKESLRETVREMKME